MRLRCQGCCREHHHAYHGLPKAWAERSVAKIKANSLPPQRGLWAKTLRSAHGRHVLFFEERKEKERRKRPETAREKREENRLMKAFKDTEKYKVEYLHDLHSAI